MAIQSTTLYICIALFLIGCGSEKPENVESNSSKHFASESYKPPVFESDNRVEQIKKIAPRLQELIRAHAESNHIPGIAYGIVVDNELVIASSTGLIDLEGKVSATTKSAFRIASMSKSFTAMAIMKLRDEGKLSLSDPVSKFIPEMSTVTYLTDDSPIINIKNLLTMTAGFPEDNPWGDRQLDEPDQMLIDLIANGLSFSNPPSYSYEYSNTGFAILGNIISRVSGMPYQEYINQNILLPLGMKETYWEYDSVPDSQLALGYRWEDEQWKSEPLLHDGSYGAMGGLITTIEDFSKYVSFHLSAWPPRSDEDTGPVKRSTLREMHTPNFVRLYSNARDFSGNTCPTMVGYGYGLSISESCNRLKEVSHGGALPGFGSNYKFYPEYGIGVMAFCNLTYTSPYPFSDIGKLLFDSLELQPRKLPVSDMLAERQKQVVELIKGWDPELEAVLLAENFYLDKSRDHRIAEIQEILNQAGNIKEVLKIDPQNQLRGRFKMEAENGFINVFFTLTPEKDPKVQQLNVWLESN
ncbi:MAG: serine hydrolase domain-containing protein [Bacteroidota bacterium]